MRKDLLLDDDFDLLISNGDLVVGESDTQHKQLILMSAPGEWRQHPLLGCNLKLWLNAPLDSERIVKMKSTINKQLESDGYVLKSLSLNSDETLNIEV